SIKADDVLDHLRDLFLIRGVPRHIRSDNGPEFIARAIREFLAAAGVGTLYIKPGSPWERLRRVVPQQTDGGVERFGGVQRPIRCEGDGGIDAIKDHPRGGSVA